MKNNYFNIIVAGVGGQGLITLTQILAEAVLIEGYDVKTSELHGLSQRGGSIETHVRFGKKIFSPLVVEGKADFILALEISEALKAGQFANKKTIFLINDNYIPFEEGYSKEAVNKKLKVITNKEYIIPASDICRKELGNEVVSGIYLLGYAVFKKLIPLKPESILKAIEEVVPEKYLEMNKKSFNLAKTK